MGKCVYVYNGKEYATAEDLKNDLSNITIDMKITEDFVVKGTDAELDFQETVLRNEAITAYGTDEVLSVIRENGQMRVFIDGAAIADITSNEKLVKLSNGDTVSINVEDLINQEKQGVKIPNIIAWSDIKREYYVDLSMARLLNGLNKPSETQVNDLKTRLVNFAQSLGISITTLESYLKDKSLRDNTTELDVKGLADIFERLIAIADKNDVDALTEEVAHFAIEFNIDQEIVQKMIRKVNETSYYQAEAANYRLRYASDELTAEQLENKVRKEILGKILADKIKDNFNKESANSTEIGIFTQLGNIWNSFLNLFRNLDRKFLAEFGKTLDNIASNVLNNNAKEFSPVDSKEIYYALSGTPHQSIHDSLERQIQQLERNYKTSKTSSKKVKIAAMREALALTKYAEMLNISLGMLATDVNNIYQTIKNLSDTELTALIKKGDIAGVNLLQFQEIFPNYITVFKSEINRIVKDKADREVLKNIAIDLENKFNSISTEVKDLAREELLNQIRELFVGMPDADIEAEIQKVVSNNFKDVSFVTQHIASINTVDNPLFKLAYALTVKSEAQTKQRIRNFSDVIRKIQNKFNISDELSQKLLDGLNLINPWKTSEVNAYIEAKKKTVEDKYKELIANEKDDAKKEDLLNQMYGELYEIEIEYTEGYVIDSERRKFLKYTDDKGIEKYYSPSTRSLIQERASQKARIYNKYRSSINGTIDILGMTHLDKIELDNIDSDFKKATSYYNEDGSLKEGILLKIAQELNYYKKGISESISDEALSAQDLNSFIQELNAVKNLYGANSLQFKNWLSQNAQLTYEDDTDVETTINVESTMKNFNPAELFKVREGLITANNYSLSDITDAYTNNDLIKLSEIFADTRQALVTKRKELVNPYRLKGDYMEIDGNKIQSNSLLVDALYDINTRIRKFSVETESEDVVKSIPNKAYKKRLLEAQGNQRLINALMKDAMVINGVPTAYHYRTFEIQGKAKVFRPSLTWLQNKDVKDLTANLNPKFNQNLAGKTIQPKIDNKELEQFINNDFFETFGISKDTDFWGEKGVTKNEGLYNLRQAFINEKKIVDEDMKLKFSLFKLPYILANTREINEKGIKSTFKASIERGLLVNEQDDDILGGGVERIIPKRYLQPEDADASLLTTDVSFMFSKYFEKAYDYVNKNSILPQIVLLEQQVKDARYGDNYEKGEKSRSFRMMQTFLDRMIYGRVVSEIGTIGVGGGKKVSLSKFMSGAFSFMRDSNLAFNAITPMVGALSAKTMATIEAVSGNQITKEDLWWADKKVASMIPSYTTDTASINAKSELKQLFELFGVNTMNEELYDGIFKSKTYRFVQDIGYVQYKAGTSVTGGMAMMAVLSGYRLYKGEFINRNVFLSKDENKGLPLSELREKWNSLKDVSAYSFIKRGENRADFDANLLKVAGYQGSVKDLHTKMMVLTNSFHQTIEGQTSNADRANIYNNPLTMFFGLHLPWYFNFIQNRFKSKSWDSFEGRYKEGNYLTAGRLFKEGMSDPNTPISDKFTSFINVAASVSTLGLYQKGLQGLEEFEATNLKRIGADMYALGMLFFGMVLANIAADDDEEDWIKQYVAYVATRALLEQSAITPPFAVTQTFGIIKEPVAGGRTLEMIADLGSHIVEGKAGKIVQSGRYEGLPTIAKDLLQLTFVRNIYTPVFDDYRKSNLYIRNNTTGFHNFGYKFVTGE